MNFNSSCFQHTRFERYPKLIYKSYTQNELHFTGITRVLNSLIWRVSLLEKYRGERVNYKYQEYGLMVRKVHISFGKGGYSLGTGR
jgi:hypothetical protein